MSIHSIKVKFSAAATFAFFGLVSLLAAQEAGAPQGSTMMQGDQGPHLMMSPGLMMPVMNPAKGRKLFAEKGCVACHSVNGIGGTDAAALDASTMTPMMNPFDFTARMWTGAEAMIDMQREELGEQIQFTGQELADIIAFAHDAEEQKKFSEADIPPEIDKLLHADEEDGRSDHEMKGGNEMMKRGGGMKH
ncbi:exported hypothetical protein [Mesorhizobium sp. ORS 3324]|nr:exported hypothetical protein [Mesorhizobium sp. ORS 3324]